MKKASLHLLIAFMLVLSFSACEQFFTNSPLKDLQRDPGDLDDEQFQAAAEAALETGDTDEIAEIYEAMDDLPPVEDDPEAYMLAAELGVGGSGMNDLVEDILEDPEGITTYTDLDEMLAEMNIVYLNEAADNLLALQAAIDSGLVTGVNISDEQLLSAATGMISAAILAAGGSENFENNYPGLIAGNGLEELQKAQALLAAMDEVTTVEDIGTIMGLTL
jgi:hypothetical protein